MSDGLNDPLLGQHKSIRDNPYWNIILLALAWAMTLSTSTLLTTIGPLCAVELNLSNDVAAFTIGAFLIGAAVSSVPSGPLFRVYGRYIGFTTGCVCQLIGGGLGILGMTFRVPTALFMSCFFLGLSQGLGQFYRFSAMEVAPPHLKSRAVTYVLTGGVLSAFLGPTTATYSNNILPQVYVGSFILMGGIAFLNQIVILLVKFPQPPQQKMRKQETDFSKASASDMDTSVSKCINGVEAGQEYHKSTDSSVGSSSINTAKEEQMRTRCEIVSQPLFIVSCTVATLAHTLMVMVMSNVSVAMTDNGFSFSQANLVLEMHFLAMFAPGFVTGTLMSIIGTFMVSLVGAVLFAGSAVVLAIGTEFWNYMIGMVLIGIAWNFSFTAGTVMLSGCYSPVEAAEVQAINDFILFSIAGGGSLASGFVYADLGWLALIYLVSALMAVNLLLFIWMRNYANDSEVCVCAEEEVPDGDTEERAYGSFSGGGASDSDVRDARVNSALKSGSFSNNVRYGGSFSSANGERRISIDDARMQSMSAT